MSEAARYQTGSINQARTSKLALIEQQQDVREGCNNTQRAELLISKQAEARRSEKILNS
jgi:hypothetical protein